MYWNWIPAYHATAHRRLSAGRAASCYSHNQLLLLLLLCYRRCCGWHHWLMLWCHHRLVRWHHRLLLWHHSLLLLLLELLSRIHRLRWLQLVGLLMLHAVRWRQVARLAGCHVNYTDNKTSNNVKPCSGLSTARGPCLCNNSWIQASFMLMEHNRQ